MNIKTPIFPFFVAFYIVSPISAQTVAEPDSSSYRILEQEDTTNNRLYSEANDEEEWVDTIITPKDLTITPHQFEEASWQKIIEGINYNRAQPKPIERKQEKKSDFSGIDFSGWAAILKILLWVLLIGILVTVLVYLLNNDLFGPNNRKLSNTTTIDLDNIEQYLQESDLEKYLRQALAQKEYKQAIRLYYLMLIKALSAKQHIEWRKEKTNRQYLYELSPQPTLQTSFRESTRIFERVWYGENAFEKTDFEQVEAVFKDFLAKI